MSARFGWHLIPLSSSPSCRTSPESSSTASWPPTQQEHRRQSHCRPLPQCHTVRVRFCHRHHARPPHHTTSVLSSPSSPHGSRRSLPAGHAAASALVVVTAQSACRAVWASQVDWWSWAMPHREAVGQKPARHCALRFSSFSFFF
jgi:hypothetical protein